MKHCSVLDVKHFDDNPRESRYLINRTFHKTSDTITLHSKIRVLYENRSSGHVDLYLSSRFMNTQCSRASYLNIVGT